MNSPDSPRGSGGPVSSRGTLWWVAGAVAACVMAAAVGHYAGVGRSPTVGAASGIVSPESPEVQRAAGALGRRAMVFALSEKPPTQAHSLLGAEAKVVYGFLRLPPDVDPGQARAQWWWNGEPMGETVVQLAPEQERSGRIGRVSLSARDGAASIGSGLGEVEVTFGGKRLARGSFVAAESAAGILAQESPPLARPRVASVVTAGAVDAEGRPVGAKTAFGGDERIWVVFDYENVDAGAAFLVRWYCEDHELPPARSTVRARGRRGVGRAWIEAGGARKLPPAKYRATISYGSESDLLGETDFTVTSAGGAEAAPATGTHRNEAGQSKDASKSNKRSNSSPSE